MATPPPPTAPPGIGNFEDGPLPAAPQPPGTDMTGICFRDQLWLNTYPLDRNLVFDYFALSPFYDWACNNEQLRMRSIHPLDLSQLSYDFSSSISFFFFLFLLIGFVFSINSFLLLIDCMYGKCFLFLLYLDNSTMFFICFCSSEMSKICDGILKTLLMDYNKLC